MASVTSAQTSYANQPGYNDCMPGVFSSSSKSSSTSLSSKASRGPIPPTPTSLTPPPGASSVPPPPKSIPVAGTDSKEEPEEDITESKPTANPEHTSQLLNSVLTIESKLPEREFSHYKTRLQQLLPSLPAQHLDVVHGCFECVLNKPSTETQTQARQEIIDYMMAHNGVSAWALPLRKVIESMVL